MVDPVSLNPPGRTHATTVVTRPSKQGVRSDEPQKSDAKPGLPMLLNLAQELTQQGPPIDHAKVAEIRDAIGGRSYKIDANAIASAIVSFGRIQRS
jgi:flagellar biosynthesis anti-sigma factor FlgM